MGAKLLHFQGTIGCGGESLQLMISDSENKMNSSFHLATLIFIVAGYSFEIKCLSLYFPLSFLLIQTCEALLIAMRNVCGRVESSKSSVCFPNLRSRREREL